MNKLESRTETVTYITAYICDVCGKEFNFEDDIFETQEMVHINFTGGYGSIFGDGDTMRLDICQHCLKEKLGNYLRLETANGLCNF
jgi:hypothetical protein